MLVELVLREAVLQRPAKLLLALGKCLGPVLGRRSDGQRHAVDHVVETVAAGSARKIGRLALFDLAIEAPVEDARTDGADQVLASRGPGIGAFFIGSQRAERHRGHQLLIEEIANPARLQFCGSGQRLAKCRALRLPVAEIFLDLGDRDLRLDIADEGDEGVLGAIVTPIEGHEFLAWHRLDRFRNADRQAVHDLAALGEEAEPVDGRAVGQRIPGEFFRCDDATLAVDRIGIEQQVLRRLAHQEESFVQHRFADGREVQLVDRLVETRAGIGIRAERQPVTLEPLDHLALGDVDRPVESHVFEKMRDALLGIGLVERTGGDAHADRRIAARGLILHHRVAQTVG